MSVRAVLWALIALDMLILLPAIPLAANAAGIALGNRDSFDALAVAALFLALPVFCLAAPLAAWRAHAHRGRDRHALMLAAAPAAYAAFLMLFLYSV